MSNTYWNQYQPPPGWMPPSPPLELPLEYRFEQMKLLGSIDARLENVQEDVSDLRDDFNRHVENCRPPRPRSLELAKEHWSIILTIGIVALQYLLTMAGQPELANRLNSSASQQSASGDSSR